MTVRRKWRGGEIKEVGVEIKPPPADGMRSGSVNRIAGIAIRAAEVASFSIRSTRTGTG